MLRQSQGIKGITRKSLLTAWKKVRREMRRATYRDVVDFVEYDIEPNVWINRLLRQIAQGSYEPHTPRFFVLAKSKGLFRRMAFPRVEDIVVYRACVDYLYSNRKKREHRHVYFERGQLSKEQKTAISEGTGQPRLCKRWKAVLENIMDYETGSSRRFRAWLHYDQYRKHLLFKRIYPYIVATDISSFFDSILFTHVSECLHSLQAPSRLVGLLKLLLERFAYRGGIRESPPLGLPVDQFDCSRKLAHLLLFPYDEEMVGCVGEEAYLRWMDDQNFGVYTKAKGKEVLSRACAALGRLHLAPNSGKTDIFSIAQARRHYHFDLNRSLDALEDHDSSTKKDRTMLRRKCYELWRKAKQYEGKGEWHKILKRLYRHAGRARARFLRFRAVKDCIDYPVMAKRISEYIRCSGTVIEYIRFLESVWGHNEQTYPDVNVALVEGLLRLEPNKTEMKELRELASSLLKSKIEFAGAAECAATAPLLLLRFGDKRSLPSLRVAFEGLHSRRPQPVIRAAAVVYASFGIGEFRQVRKTAARLLTNYLAEIVRFVERIQEYDTEPKSYGSRLQFGRDGVTSAWFIDMRTAVTARLLSLNRKRKVRNWLAEKKATWLRGDLSEFDKKLIGRLFP